MTSRLQALRSAFRAAGAALRVAASIALASTAALADEAKPAPAPPAASATASSVAANVAPDPAATLMVFNRPVVQFQASLPGVPPEERARRAREEIDHVLRAGGPAAVKAVQMDQNTVLLLDDIGVFGLLPGDLTRGQSVDGIVAALQRAVGESREARSFGALLRGAGFALLATLVYAGLLWALLRWRSWAGRTLVKLGHRHGKRLSPGGVRLLTMDRIYALARLVTASAYYLLVAVATVEWLAIVLSQFPYTRRWGENLNESVFELAVQIAEAFAASLPGLAVAVAIFFVARGLLGLIGPFFSQVEHGDLNLPWIDRYTVRATRGLVHIGVWLFALAMAYPYLPGSQTEAFKGISVVLGLMISLGSSNVIGQAIGGLILTYSHTLRIGEYVRIGDVEGTVTEMGTFATRIRTGLGEELTLPNSMIVGTVTKNYSRTVKGSGYVVDTVLTIGYDTPWRQVHAMMIEAAQRTEGILDAPKPHVFQTALTDFYAEYRLVAQAIATAPRPRAQVLTDLHANLQDVFNENGVQIMSPHYLADPPQAKVVPPEHWNPPLAGKR